MVYDGVNEGGEYHAAKSRYHGQDGLFEGGKLPVDHFPLDFQTHREEEDDHEDVVDELLHRHAVREHPVDGAVRRLDVHGESRIKESVIRVLGKGQVGQ